LGNHTVTVTDSKGCTAETNITIIQPSPLITIASNDTTICYGQSTSLFASANGGNGGYYYSWSQGLGFGNNILVQDSSTQSYIVTAYDNRGCIGTPDTLTIGVIVLTPANLKINGTTPICPGANTTISAQVVGTAGIPTYIWNNGLGSGSGPFTVTPAKPTTYVVTASNSCGITLKDSITIVFRTLPTAIPIFNIKSGCRPLIVQFTDSSSTVDPIISWLWNFGDNNSSTQQNPAHTYNQAGNYLASLKVTTSGQCSNTSPASDTIIVLPTPNAICSASSYDTFTKTNISFVNSSTGSNQSLWNFGDNTTSSQSNPTHSYANIGTYPVTLAVTNQYNCSDTCTLSVTIRSDIIFPTIFTPNPNGPNGGRYDINSLDNNIFFGYAQGIVDFSFQIFNRWGEMIFESKDISIGWDGYYKGKICEQDVYVWKATGKFNDGRKFEKAGNVMLLR